MNRSMTLQSLIELHNQNKAWVNQQIRICLLARRLLKGVHQNKYWQMIHDASEHHHPELLPLKTATDNECYRLRFENYNLGLLNEVFDIRKWIYEARALKWKEQEKSWLKDSLELTKESL